MKNLIHILEVFDGSEREYEPIVREPFPEDDTPSCHHAGGDCDCELIAIEADMT